MTLLAFPPENLDKIALRFLDVAGRVRRMALRSREAGLDAVPLHANKPQEWLAKLEAWAYDAELRVETAINRERGARRAREMTERPRKKTGRRGERKRGRRV
jgi:hypothetical protein